MRIYLQKDKVDKLGENEKIKGLQTHPNSDEPYIDIMYWFSPVDPAFKIPEKLKNLILEIICTQDIHENFSPEGIYKTKKATILIDTYMNHEYGTIHHQKFSMQGKSLKALQILYKKIRTGKSIVNTKKWIG